MGYFRIIIFLLSFSAISQNYYYAAGAKGEPVELVDFFPTGSAASSGVGEVNSTTGWAAYQSTITSVGTEYHDGNYSIKMVPTVTSGSFSGRRDFSGLNTAKNYKVTFWAKTDVSIYKYNMTTTYVDGVAVLFDITGDGEWNYYEVTFKPKISSARALFGSVDILDEIAPTDILYVDDVKFLELP